MTALLDMSDVFDDDVLETIYVTYGNGDGTLVKGEMTEGTTTTITTKGVVQQIGAAQALKILPEANRKEKNIMVTSQYEFQVGMALTYDESVYAIISVEDWLNQGGFKKATCVKTDIDAQSVLGGSALPPGFFNVVTEL